MNSLVDITNRLNNLTIHHGLNKTVRKRHETMLCCDIHGWIGTWHIYHTYGGCPSCKSNPQDINNYTEQFASLRIK